MPTLTRILLIDDDAVDRMTVRRALAASDLNYELLEAPDGLSGLAHARDAAFDCVLLDFRLPDMDAFDILAELLSPDGGQHAVLMLTGDTNPAIALELMRAGALDHLAKGELTASGLARAIRYARARRSFLTELDAARREAEEKSAALDQLNRQKSLLFSIIAHDLRNPFQALLGLSETLSKAVAQKDHASIERRAQGVHESAERAHALMESLFNWAELQMDTAEIVIEDIDLDRLAADVTGGCRASAADKGLELRVECEGSQVRANRDMLATILRNLIGNAIKFTPEGGTIQVLAGGSGMIQLKVVDTGVGIPGATLTDLFVVDRRTTTLGTAGERGSGLGLLLCRDLAERLGSRLEVESIVGTGTTFCMELPSASDASA